MRTDTYWEAFGDALQLQIIEINRCANALVWALQPRDGVIFALALTDIDFQGIEFDPDECSGKESHQQEGVFPVSA